MGESFSHGAPRVAAPAAGSRSVLIADDDPAVSRASQRVLVAAGYEVVLADGGEAAMHAVTLRAFDVIVSDIQMPGMSGVELLRAVRTHDLDVPVILVTGNPTIETAIEAVSLGALQYMQKPVSNDTLVKAVQRASALHRMAQLKRGRLQNLQRLAQLRRQDERLGKFLGLM